MAVKKKDLEWFTARVLVRVTVGSGRKKTTQYEDRFILVSASDHSAAKKKAALITRAANSKYKNSKDEWVQWKFSRVVDTTLLFDKKLEDGTEVWWRYLRGKDPMKQVRKDQLVP